GGGAARLRSSASTSGVIRSAYTTTLGSLQSGSMFSSTFTPLTSTASAYHILPPPVNGFSTIGRVDAMICKSARKKAGGRIRLRLRRPLKKRLYNKSWGKEQKRRTKQAQSGKMKVQESTT